MTRFVTCLFVLSALVAGSLSAHAEADLSRMNLGAYVSGPQIDKGDLRGRIVVVEYWGVNCGPCLSAIPHVTKLAKEYGHKRLLIVANHVQGGSVSQVKETWEARAKSNYVAVVNQGNLPGFDVRGIPAAIMFDPAGNVIWQGHPASIDKPLEQAIRRYRPVKQEKEQEAGPPPIITEIEAKYFKREIEQINEQKRGIDMALSKVRRTGERASRQEQVDEANAVIAAVSTWVKAKQAEVEQARTSDPTTAYAIAEQVIELLGRDELSGDLIEIKKAMDADDALMDTIRSTRMLREIQALAESVGLTKDPSKVDERSNARDLRAIGRDLRRIISAWPETAAAKQAQTLLKDWGLDS